MAHSLEVRPPFLDHRMVEFAAKLPQDFKIRGSKLKFVLRELMKDRLPHSVLTRRKEGSIFRCITGCGPFCGLFCSIPK